MKSLKIIIRKCKDFLTSFTTETVRTGRVQDLDYLKELLARLNVFYKSGSVSEEVVGDYASRSIMERPLFNGQIKEQVSRLTRYNPKQDFADNRGLPYVKDLSFSHARQRRKDSIAVSFTWQSLGDMDIYSHYQIYLQGTLSEKLDSSPQASSNEY